MVINLYRTAIVEDNLTGTTHKACILKKYDVHGKTIVKTKFFGFGEPKVNEKGDVVVKECWKICYYFYKDIKEKDEYFNVNEKEGFFDEECYIEQNPLYLLLEDSNSL